MDNEHIVIGYKQQKTKVARNQTDLNAARRIGAVVSVDKKMNAGGNRANQGTDHQRIVKLDYQNDVAPPPTISRSVGQVIQKERMELQLSQKDLAQKINEKPSVLQAYESGKAIPNPQILGKLEKILKVKLRGSDIGKKMETREGNKAKDS